MENKKPITNYQEAVIKILEILNGRSLSENKMILDKVNKTLEGFSIFKRPIN